MLIKRDQLAEIEAHLPAAEITMLVGPRQVGKTTILDFLRGKLSGQGAKIISYNLDLESDFSLFRDQQNLIEHIRAQLSNETKTYVFIDEIQRKENAGLFLKGIFDLKMPVKWVVTGSGSLELKEKIHESLAGRKRVFEILPISFDEFLKYKWAIDDIGKVTRLAALEKDKAFGYLLEYLNYGGYPNVVVQDNVEEKVKILQEIHNSFLVRDISVVLNLKKTEPIFTLLQVLSDRIGQKIQYNNIASMCGVSVATLKNYLWYLEKMFIIDKVSGFVRNKTKEISKSPVYYFKDLGLRNYILNLNGNIRLYSSGFIFENFILHLLKEMVKNTTFQVKFWQTKDKAEVDFVVDKFYSVLPVEVKFQRLSKLTVPKSLQSFLKKYSTEEAWIINLSLKAAFQRENTKVKFISFEELIGWKIGRSGES